MLLLLTIALVVFAAVSLLIGVLADQPALIWLSIVMSLVALGTLVAVSTITKRKLRAATALAGGAVTAGSPEASSGAPAPVTDERPVDEPTVATAAFADDRGEDEAEMPIDGYDGLRVNEILPRLATLDADELETVREHEEAGKGRATILKAIDSRLSSLDAAGATAGAAGAATTEPAGFPIAGYDRLSTDEVIARLDGLTVEELEEVFEREEQGQARDAVLDRIDERLDELDPLEPAAAEAPAPATAKSGAKKAPTKVPSTAKAPVGTATPGRTSANKATAKKATAKKATAKKATATKAAGTSKTAATKAPATKKAPAKKAGAATKAATTKKAAGTKKAAPAKAAAKRSR